MGWFFSLAPQLHPRFSHFTFFLLNVCSAFMAISCASSPMIQPQINGLVVADRYQAAAKVLTTHPQGYGANNELLYWLDRGLVFHLAGDYPESILAFDQAKHLFDDLWTKSLTQEAATWLINDYAAPYRGEDFERVMINIFQALNYIAMGELEEALVEARDIDGQLTTINLQYPVDQKNVYKEDAFARLLMGILYEAGPTPGDWNDAFISYQKSAEIYETNYQSHYEIQIPIILKENLLTLAQGMGKEVGSMYEDKYPEIQILPWPEKLKMGEVYCILYTGLSPLKRERFLPIPLPDGYITKLAFPVYESRTTEGEDLIFSAHQDQRLAVQVPLELGEDIEGIARQNLENRKGRILAKAVARPAGKYFLELQEERSLKEKFGDKTARWSRYLSNMYNVYSEQADLRSWQTLPAKIHIGRLLLPPGHYTFEINGEKLESLEIKAGQKEFLINRLKPKL